MMRLAAILALPLALSACGSADEAQEPEQPQAHFSDIWESAALVVGENGMSKLDGDALAVAGFGDSRESVEGLLRIALGDDPEKTSNEECGAGPMEFTGYGPLQVGYQDGRFVGWFLRASDNIMTMDRVQPGVTKLSELKQQREVREIDSTLPGEFEFTTSGYGTIRGFSEGDEIVALQAGMSCFFR